MELSASKRNLGRVAALIAIGLAWAGMSLAAIILNKLPEVETPETYTGLLGHLLYYRFIVGPATSYTVRSSDFVILMWVYFIISVGWVALSIDQYAAIHYNKDRQKLITLLWGAVTLITCLIDFVFVCLLARDYSDCADFIESDDANWTVAHLCYLTTGIAMTLAARGYTLWLINVIFALYIINMSMKIKKNDKLANYFSNHSIPRVTLTKVNRATPDLRGDLTPNYLNNESAFESFPYQSDTSKFDTADTLPSFQSRSDKGSANQPTSFLSRGEKFSY